MTIRKITYNQYLDKIFGCFIGKAVSGNIGAPHEGVKMPLNLEFMPEMINPSLPNDDLDLQVLWLDVVEEKGSNFTSYDLLRKFVECCDYSPGEYAVMRKNFMRGVYPPYSGKFCNDLYIEGMGCPIRSEIWGCIAAGNMELACEFASRDGQLDHFGESIEAERFLAAMESEAFFDSDINSLLDKAMSVLRTGSKFGELVKYTRELCRKYNDIKVVLTKLLIRYGHHDCTNMYQNMGIIIASLLLGNNDIIKTSIMALNCGFDTDCTCATAGAVLGLIFGAEKITAAYGISDITYALGVRARERSNKICDLAAEIAAVGVKLANTVNSEIFIENAPDVNLNFDTASELSFCTQYDNMNPSLAFGESRTVNLIIKNSGKKSKKLFCRISEAGGIVCSKPEFEADVPADSEISVPVVFTLPKDTEIVYERNIFEFTAIDTDGKTALQADFGIVGATPWKLSGPFWRTEPICTTEMILDNFSEKTPYAAILHTSAVQGSFIDKMRQFHLNFAADTDTAFVSEDELFKPLDDACSSGLYEQSLVNIAHDSFSLDDFFGFKGPCTVYLSRILVSETETEAFVQIGHTAPFKLYINDELIAERSYCDTWTAENVHTEAISLKKGENRIVMRITRVNFDAKFNVTFSKEIATGEHIVSFASKNPYKF